MQYQTLEKFPPLLLLETFNQAFSDYINPTPALSEKVFDWKIQRDGTDSSLSVGMFGPEGELWGLILHAPGEWKGKKAVYNGGTGIIPAQRGKKGAIGMYDFILPILKEKGVEGSILECIIGNDVALKLYQKIGFQLERELICYMGKLPQSYFPPENVYWKMLDQLDWPYLQSFWDCLPSWQNSIHAVDRVSWSYEKLGIFEEGKLVGYGIINPLNGYIPQFGIHPEHRRKGLGKFLFSLLQSRTERQLALINIDKDSPSIPAFAEALELGESLRQHELWLPFDEK